MKFYNYLNEAGFKDLPKGGTRKSVEKFVKSLVGKDPEDKSDEFFTKCFNKMKDEEGFDEEGAKKFCATLKDEFYGTEMGRGKGKKDKEWRNENINEGTWATPFTIAKAKSLQKTFRKPLTRDEAKNKLGNVLGNDDLYDTLEDAIRDDEEGDTRQVIASWLWDNGVGPKAPRRKGFVDWDDEAGEIVGKIARKYK